MLSRAEIAEALNNWNRAWAEHDLEGVMALFHDEVLFEHWTGSRVRGRKALREGWAPWFAEHGGFFFVDEETFIDEAEQKALYRWEMHWPSQEPGYEGQPEVRRGIDVLHFQDGRIIQKLSYTKTTVEIAGERKTLRP